MSTFLNRFMHNSSGQIVTNSNFGGTPTFHDGLAYDETGPDTLVVSSAGGTPASYQAGIGFNSAGAMLIVEASAGLPAGTVWQSGLPISVSQLCVDATNAVAYYFNGVGYTSVGAVAVTDAGGPPPPAFYYLQEAGGGKYQTEDGSGDYIRE